MDALAVWCRRWLGAPPAAQLFEAGYLSTVKGLRLADGREVVVKVRPRRSRLAGCAVVHRALWTAGFACPEPLVDLQPLDGYAATAETLVRDVGEPPQKTELAALSAAALTRLAELAPDPGSVPSLVPSVRVKRCALQAKPSCSYKVKPAPGTLVSASFSDGLKVM